MFRLSRTSVIAWTAVVAVIAALSYALTGVAVPRAAAEDKAKAAPVEFTADGKLKRPVGYRKWVYVGEVITPNDMNDGEASFPEFHSVFLVYSIDGLIHERERRERHHAGGAAVRKEEVSHFNWTFSGLHHVGLDLRSQASANSNEQSFEPVFGGDFQFAHKFVAKLDGVVHLVTLSRSRPSTPLSAAI